MPKEEIIKEKIIEILKEAEQLIGSQDYDKDAEKFATQICGLIEKRDKAEAEILKELKGLQQLSPAEAWERIRKWAIKLNK